METRPFVSQVLRAQTVQDACRSPAEGDGRHAGLLRCPGGERGELGGRMMGAMPMDDRNDGHTVDALALDADEGRGHATKCSGEALAAGEPEISEWGNPPGVMAGYPFWGREPGELKHLSTPRKREDALSSGERTGQSPNHDGVRAGMRCRCGVVRSRWTTIPGGRAAG